MSARVTAPPTTSIAGGEGLDIRLERAGLNWQQHCVFSELDLELPSGKWTSILGQSGVGKSSLLQLLCGIADGAGVTGDIHCSDGAPLAGRVAWMAQDDLLLPWLSVLDNVLQGARLKRNPKVTNTQRERGHHLLSQVGLADKARSKPAQLSGGQRRSQ